MFNNILVFVTDNIIINIFVFYPKCKELKRNLHTINAIVNINIFFLIDNGINYIKISL